MTHFSQPLVAMSLIWVCIFAYAVFACVDFGAGFLYLIARIRGRSAVVSDIVHQFQSPVWEVVNVLLVAVLVGLIGFFPGAALYYGTSLLIPGSIALILMVLRGTFIVFQHYQDEEPALMPFIHGISGLLIPAALVTVLPLSEGGYVTMHQGVVAVHLALLVESPMLWAFVLLALATVGYFSTMYMAYYAKKHSDHPAEQFFRSIALFTGPPAFFFAGLAAISMHNEAHIHFLRMLHWWPVFTFSALLFLLAGRLVYERRYGTAFVAAILQYMLVVGTYGWTHLPYLMYPYLTLENGFTSAPMFYALLITFGVGLLLLLPGLWLFYRMFLAKPRIG